MPLSTDKIPNQPLSGTEVMNYSLALVSEYCERFRAYPVKLKIEYTMKNPTMPRYSIQAGRIPHETPDTPKVALDALISQARATMQGDYVFGPRLVYPRIGYQITLWFLNHDGLLAQRELSGEVDNPNLIRVHYQLPIVQTEKIIPTEESPFGGIRNITLDVDRSQYPSPKAPMETDLTPHIALYEKSKTFDTTSEVSFLLVNNTGGPITQGPEEILTPDVLSESTLDEFRQSVTVDNDQPRTRRKRA